MHWWRGTAAGFRASSAGPGHGSTFTLTLPLLQMSALAEPRPEGVGTGNFLPLRVLVVDDNTDSADTMVQLLLMLHHRAEVAYGVRQGFEIARRWAPEVVLVDLNMPDGGGFALTKQLRALPALRPDSIAAADRRQTGLQFALAGRRRGQRKWR